MNHGSARRPQRNCLGFLFAILVLSACGGEGSGSLTVSAAASLSFAFEEIAPLFERETNLKVAYNFASSGRLTHQIEEGAPVDVFASANAAYVDRLAEQGLIVPESRHRFARGALALWMREDSPLAATELRDVLQAKRFAIANPAYAPYGVAARQALQRAGLWDRMQDRLILAANVRQTMQYAASGNVDAALVAVSLGEQSTGKWIRVDEKLYDPIYQVLVVIKDSPRLEAAHRFSAFLRSDPARAVLQRYGFLAPEVGS